MKFRFIRAEKANRTFPVRLMCRVLGVSFQGFYAWCQRPECNRVREDRKLAVHLRAAFEANERVYGAPRLCEALAKQGMPTSRRRVARLMRQEGIQVRPPPRRVRTTQTDPSLPVVANLVDRHFEVEAPNRVWTTDVTYLPTKVGWVYLAVVLDLFSRKVVGWEVGPRNDTDLVLRALKNAVVARKPEPGLIHHSDRGSTYASARYQEELRRQGMVCSMSRKGDCWDNAPTESFFGTLKEEKVYRLERLWEDEHEAKASVFDFIERFYNRKRMHSTLGYLSPQQFEERASRQAA